MNKLKKTFSLRKKKDLSEDESNEDDWQEDELRVRQGRCSFLLEVSISSIISKDSYLACDHLVSLMVPLKINCSYFKIGLGTYFIGLWQSAK